MIAIDMPMPKNCAGCPFYDIDHNIGCDVNGREFTNEEYQLLYKPDTAQRPDWCPLIDLNERKEGADDV